ncbi:MAG: hypothetical protein L0H70_06255, partial [Xanthomonadales bacterium]|nr:hypothetical protein [Xanthomonadales bacterium]
MALKKPNLLDDDNVQQLPAATVTAPAAKVAKIKRPSLGTRIGNAGKNSIEDTGRYIGNTIKVMRAGKTALDNAISYPSRVGAGFTRDAARAFVGLEPSHNEGLPTAPEMGPGPGNKLQSFEVTSNAPALTNPRAAPANTAGGAAATPTTPTLPNVQAEHALFAGNVPGQDYRMGAQGQHVYSDGSNGIPATMTLDQVSGKAALQHPGTVTALSADDTKYAFGAPSTSAILGHTPTHAEGVAYQTSQLQRPNQQLFHTSPEMFAKSDAASVASGDWRSGIGRAAGNARSVLNNPRASAAAKRDAGQSLRSLNAIPAAEYAAATGAQLQGQQNAAALTQEQARGANQRATTNLIGQNQLHNTRLAGENQRANTNLIGQNQLHNTRLAGEN